MHRFRLNWFEAVPLILRLMAGAEDLNVTALNKHVGPRVVDPLYGRYGNEV